jgi:SNF2 family DNA or RNA helicase
MAKQPPRYKHQQAAFTKTKDLPAAAFLMEMGTGKTRPAIETAIHQFSKNNIEAMVVFAPNGVQRNWVLNELPKWCSIDYRATWWNSHPNKQQAKDIENITARPYTGLRILCVNYESANLLTFKKYILKFLKSFKTMLVMDESTRIKTPSAKRTKFILSLAKYAPYRRIMSGFATPNSPFDIYSQFQFLDPTILGFGSFFAFKAHFAEIEDNKFLLKAIQDKNKARAVLNPEKHYSTRAPQMVKHNPVTGLPEYRNLDELNKLIQPYSFRAVKNECLDLPPKVYNLLPVELTSKQQHIYNQVRDELLAEFEEGEMTTTLAIVKMIRLQQITGGFWKLDETRDIQAIDGKFPKLEAIMESIEGSNGKVAIWTHFTHENELITDSIKSAYGEKSVVQYYGHINNKMKQIAVDRFQNIVRIGNKQHDEDTGCRFFVGEPHSGGIGIELTNAEDVYYYSNSFNLEDRLQSEDRHHRSGTNHTVTYNDVEVIDTIDKIIISSLRSKKEIAHVIMGDKNQSWLR